MRSQSQWRRYLLLIGYLSALLGMVSAQLYFNTDAKFAAEHGLEITPDKFYALQLPSMFAHPMFAVPALLLGHGVVNKASEAYPAVKLWAMAGCVVVTVLYARSLLPGIGIGFPAVLTDLLRTGMWGFGLWVLYSW